MKKTYKNDIGILHFDGEIDQFLAFLREDKEKFNDAISIYQAGNEVSSTFPNLYIILEVVIYCHRHPEKRAGRKKTVEASKESSESVDVPSKEKF